MNDMEFAREKQRLPTSTDEVVQNFIRETEFSAAVRRWRSVRMHTLEPVGSRRKMSWHESERRRL